MRPPPPPVEVKTAWKSMPTALRDRAWLGKTCIAYTKRLPEKGELPKVSAWICKHSFLLRSLKEKTSEAFLCHYRSDYVPLSVSSEPEFTRKHYAMLLPSEWAAGDGFLGLRWWNVCLTSKKKETKKTKTKTIVLFVLLRWSFQNTFDDQGNLFTLSDVGRIFLSPESRELSPLLGPVR